MTRTEEVHIWVSTDIPEDCGEKTVNALFAVPCVSEISAYHEIWVRLKFNTYPSEVFVNTLLQQIAKIESEYAK